jgi:hypothetical protein
MNRRTNDQVFDAVAGNFIVEKTDITQRVMKMIQQESHTIRVRSYATLSLMIVLLILLFTIPQVTSAMRQWFGFLPGVGMVDQSSPVRVLQEAVSQERNGVTVMVEQLYALSDRTVIQYKVSGIPESAYPKNLPGSDMQGFQNACDELVFLRLPDGKTLTYSGYDAKPNTMNVAQYELNFTVRPVPGNIDTVTLVMPCIDGTEQDAIPGAWELPLRLIPATDQVQLLPVYPVSTATPVLSDKGANADTPLLTTDARQNAQHGIRLTVDQIVPLPEGDLLLYGMVQWDENTPFSAVTLNYYEIVDAQGKRIPYDLASLNPAKMPSPGDRFVPFAFQIKGPLQDRGPITLKVSQMHTNAHFENVGFTLDTGAAPSVNQQWLLDQDVQAGKYIVHVNSVTRLVDGYAFTFQTEPETGYVIDYADMYIPSGELVPPEWDRGMTTIQYDGDIPVPTGKLWIGIYNLGVNLPGDWQVTWLPPDPSGK